ncbi:putative alpha beta-hydrolase [Rosellinia necatrix]|uniref:Putative alpha beta-hydrolase n=1 Tax=Rosellinia necatrix TaxID=77044 RepID=A0A1W2TT93_ROSNE|nr:putative alpha beta-hydrolase [Rosellinia necatrix]
MWLRDLLPSRLPDARIMTYGYNASIFTASKSDLLQDAVELLQQIQAKRRDATHPILFIAHSLGGLVLKRVGAPTLLPVIGRPLTRAHIIQALCLAKNDNQYAALFRATRGVVFMGTPHRGSSLASPALVLAGILTASGLPIARHRLKALQVHSNRLFDLTNDFRRLTSAISILSFYETKPTPPLPGLVVQKDSAFLGLADETIIPLDANHRDICRFPDDKEGGLFYQVAQQLDILIENMRAKADIGYGGVDSEGVFFVPISLNQHFTGRASIISEIQTYFEPGEHGQKVLVLTGLGGIGKTQIASAFAYEAHRTNVFSTVVWIFSASRTSILRSFSDLVKHIGLSTAPVALTTDLDISSVLDNPQSEQHRDVMAVHIWLQELESKNWLLVFDNWDDVESVDLDPYIPKLPFGNILITSRRQAVAKLGKHIEVDIMERDDSIELLYRCSRMRGEVNCYISSAAGDLVDVLGRLPLAIDQAGSYIAEQAINFTSYLDLFESNKAQLLTNKPPKAVWSYEHSVFTTWEISYNQLSTLSPLSTMILDLCAFFQSDEIPIEITIILANAKSGGQVFLSHFLSFVNSAADYSEFLGDLPQSLGASEIEVIQAIGKLLSFSLLMRKQGSRSLRMHPLVHAWSRERQQESRRPSVCQTVISLVSRALFNACDLRRFGEASQLYAQAFVTSEHIEEFAGLDHLINPSKLLAALIAVNGWVAMSQDQATMERSDKFLSLVQTRDYGYHIPDGLLQNRQVLRLLSKGDFAQLEVVAERFVRSAKPSTRQEKVYLCSIVQIYAPCLYRQLRYTHAIDVFSISDTSADPSGYFQARKDLTLGGIWCDMGKLDESERILKACQSILLDAVGPNHFIWSVSYQLLALCYIAQRKYLMAEQLIQPLVDNIIVELSLNQRAPTFADYEVIEICCRACRKQGKYAEALVVLNKLLEKTTSVSPPPARALAELSLVLTRLDLEMSIKRPSRIVIDGLMEEASETFRRAEFAYRLEWTRGTWVFKFFEAMIEDIRHHCSQSTRASRIDDDFELCEIESISIIADEDNDRLEALGSSQYALPAHDPGGMVPSSPHNKPENCSETPPVQMGGSFRRRIKTIFGSLLKVFK